MLFRSVERVRTETRTSFASTISSTDLIVGARSGSVNLLLYSVFRIGNATNNIRWSSFEHFAKHPKVAWAVPMSLGDSHHGYRVLGTSEDYFTHYQYSQKQHLKLRDGRFFSNQAPFEVVLGAEVADALNYQLGQEIVLNSSRISPTISSRISSIVTIPAVPPYSSMINAICTLSLCILTSASLMRDDSVITGSS